MSATAVVGRAVVGLAIVGTDDSAAFFGAMPIGVSGQSGGMVAVTAGTTIAAATLAATTAHLGTIAATATPLITAS